MVLKRKRARAWRTPKKRILGPNSDMWPHMRMRFSETAPIPLEALAKL
jgi:hypothetical protein